MNSTDFLPTRYRRDHDQRRRRTTVALAAGLCAILIATLAYSQTRQLTALKGELAYAKLQYDVTSKQASRLVEVREKLKNEQSAAKLYTYLRHPWPLTQVLSAVLAPLPRSIRLEELRVTHEAKPASAALRDTVKKNHDATSAEAEQLTPSERTLAALRAERSGERTVVFVSGITHDEAQLHSYLSDLDDQSMILKARLISSRLDETSEARRYHFKARLIIIGGYGEPDGPKPADQTIQTARRERN